LYRIVLNALPIVFPAHLALRIRLRRLLSLQPTSLSWHDPTFRDSDSRPSSPASAVLHVTPDAKSAPRRRSARLSASAKARQIWIHKNTHRWHAIAAGAIAGGLAVMFEKRSRRTVIAQQLFVRYGHFPSWTSVDLKTLSTFRCTEVYRAPIMHSQTNETSTSRMVMCSFSHCRTPFFISRL